MTVHNRRIRVAHVTAIFPPYWSGTGNVAYYNAVELARRGYEIHVFTARFPLNGYQDPKEIHVHRLWTPFRIGNAPLTPGLLAELQNFDLVHLHWPFIFGAELTWLATRFVHLPYVITYHLDLKADRRRIFGPYQKIWGPVIARRAKRVIAVSTDHLKTSQIFPSIKEHPEVIAEIPNGVDTGKFIPTISGKTIRERYGIPIDAFVILFVGAMDKAHEYKGVPDLLETFGLIYQPQIWLLLAGGGELLPEYMKLASRLPSNAAQNIVFTGPVTHQQLPAYYTASNVCVLPSRQPESFGIVLIEAMACGKPVIASDSPGVRSVVSDGEDGFIFDPGDKSALANKLLNLLENPPVRREMGAAGRKKVESQYGWEQISYQLSRLYDQILD